MTIFRTCSGRFWCPCLYGEEDLPDIPPPRSHLREQLLGPREVRLRRRHFERPKPDGPVYICFFGVYFTLSIFYFIWLSAYFKDHAADNVRTGGGVYTENGKTIEVQTECTEMPDVFLWFFICCGSHIVFTFAQIPCLTPRSCWYWLNRIIRLVTLMLTIMVCIWGVFDVFEETDLACEGYIKAVGSPFFWLAVQQFEMISIGFLITVCMANIVFMDEVFAVMQWIQMEEHPDMYLSPEEMNEKIKKEKREALQKKRDELKQRKEAIAEKQADKKRRKEERARERELLRKESERQRIAEEAIEERVIVEVSPRGANPRLLESSRSRSSDLGVTYQT